MSMLNRIKQFFGVFPEFGGVPRSSRWASVRRAHLSMFPTCAVCGTKGSLLKPNEVHHIILYSQDKTKELLPSNLLTVCRDHHFFVAHLMSWSSWNKNVRQDAQYWHAKIISRP